MLFRSETSEKEQKSHLYMDMIVLIEEIADYIIPEDNEIRKGLGEIMGGKILKLRSEELLELGEARGEARIGYYQLYVSALFFEKPNKFAYSTYFFSTVSFPSLPLACEYNNV